MSTSQQIVTHMHNYCESNQTRRYIFIFDEFSWNLRRAYLLDCMLYTPSLARPCWHQRGRFGFRRRITVIQMQIHISRLYTQNIGTISWNSSTWGLFVKIKFTKRVKLERNAQSSPLPFLLPFTPAPLSRDWSTADALRQVPKSLSFPSPGLRRVLRRRQARTRYAHPFSSIPACKTGYRNPKLSYLAIYIRIWSNYNCILDY